MMKLLLRKMRAASMLVVLVGVSAQVGCQTNSILRDQGYKAMRRGDYAQARQRFARAAHREPDDYLAQFFLGVNRLKLNQPLAAQLAFEQALTLRPEGGRKNDAILDGIAEALYRQHRYDALHTFLAKTARRHGRSKDYLRQAKYLARTGDVDRAKLAYRKAAYFAKQGDARPYVAMSKFYKSVHDVPDAIRALRYGYWVNPSNPQVADGLRELGIVPGPTVRAQPPKPPLLTE